MYGILLVSKREIKKLRKYVDRKGFTIVPLKLYFKNGLAKLELGLARGKKLYDKRESIKNKTIDKEIRQAMKFRR